MRRKRTRRKRKMRKMKRKGQTDMKDYIKCKLGHDTKHASTTLVTETSTQKHDMT